MLDQSQSDSETDGLSSGEGPGIIEATPSVR